MGVDGLVYCLAVYKNQLYAGENFTSCGGMAYSYVARWESTNWTPVGSGLNGSVFSMAEYQRTLFIGGGLVVGGSFSSNCYSGARPLNAQGERKRESDTELTDIPLRSSCARNSTCQL